MEAEILFNMAIVLFFAMVGSIIVGVLINDRTNIIWKLMKAIMTVSTILFLGTCGAIFIIGAVLTFVRIIK